MSDPSMTAPSAETWGDFYAYLSREWRQGEHVALVGPTGRGKTTLALAIVPIRKWTMFVATKPKDSTVTNLRRHGWTTTRAWPAPVTARRVVLWPTWRHRSDTPRQAAAIRVALDDIFARGSWCVVLDDLQYLMEELGLTRDLKVFLTMARSMRVSMVLSTQRPRHVPVAVWNQSTHLFIWGTKDRDDLRRLGGLGGLDDKIIREAVARLGTHEVLYVNTRTGHMAVTQAPRYLGRG